MKNLYPKSKGKIHPSPTPPYVSGGGGGGDALSVLKLLPAAILALTAALAFEDKEVVAYLMIRSINGSGAAVDAGEERRRCRRAAGAHHRPLFDCGCFDCYTCFWSRWDCSKDRETIHMVVEAFEEHLASKERKGKGRGKEAKRKKKGNDEKREKEVAAVKEREDDERMVGDSAAAEEDKGCEEEAVIVSVGCLAEEKGEAAAGGDEEVDEMDEDGVVVELPAVSGGEKRRGWADVMGIFNSRLWSLWSPGV